MPITSWPSPYHHVDLKWPPGACYRVVWGVPWADLTLAETMFIESVTPHQYLSMRNSKTEP